MLSQLPGHFRSPVELSPSSRRSTGFVSITSGRLAYLDLYIFELLNTPFLHLIDTQLLFSLANLFGLDLDFLVDMDRPVWSAIPNLWRTPSAGARLINSEVKAVH
jgi:hypothetical protein